MIFHLHLLNEKTGSLHTIDIQPSNNVLGQSWSSLLKKAILSKECWLVETDRIYHLNDEWSKDNILAKMKNCIKTVNDYDNIININLDDNIDQELMNHLHTFFEHLRGKDDNPPMWYINAPRNVKDAVTSFNVLIHRYEGFIMNYKHGKITVSYKNRPTREMTLEEKSYFNLDMQPGDVYLKYCHKGKDLLDIFKDKDEHVGDENILPQHRISSDFNLNFSWSWFMAENRKNEFNEFNEWLQNKKEFLKSINIDIEDPSITIGKGVVGKIITDDLKQLQDSIFGVTKIHDITYTE
jgi:hypothetical protein